MKKLTNHLRAVEAAYQRRKHRVNSSVKSVGQLPRLIVNRTNSSIYWQVLVAWKVIAQSHDIKAESWTKTETAFATWQQIWELLKKQWVTHVAFDRNWFLYHWRVKSLADWVRSTWIIL